MKSKDFFSKLLGSYLWGNLLAMAVVILVLCIGVKYGIDLYTHHGERIELPNVTHRSYDDACRTLDSLGLKVVVTDTGYVRTLPPDCILEQSPEAGTIVKSGHIVYVIINSPHTPTLTIPDVIDNNSYREARAKLMAMGFRLTEPQYIPGEREWVYGILVNGRSVATGDKVSIDDALTIQVGDGRRSLSDSVSYIDPVYDESDYVGEDDEVDEFEVVTGAETPTRETPTEPEKKNQNTEPTRTEKPSSAR